MARKRPAKRAKRRRRPVAPRPGPPPRETTAEPTDREGAGDTERRRYTSTGPELAGGDVDADWRRGDTVGEEAVGGSVATPDQDTVDRLGEALGVPRAPDDEVRTSREILEGRDRYRWEEEENER